MYIYEISRVLITNNGKQFIVWTSEPIVKIIKVTRGLRLWLILKLMGRWVKKRLDKARVRWVNKLLSVLWSYRTTSKSSTEATPFMLTYVTEAVVSIEVGIASLHVGQFEEQMNQEGLKMIIDLVDEVRDETYTKVQEYKRKASNYYNLWVKGIQFLKVGSVKPW